MDDSEALFNRAVKAGAKVQIPIDNQFWGDRAGAVADPAGYTWWIATHKEDLTHDEIQERAGSFFHPFGWARSAPPRVKLKFACPTPRKTTNRSAHSAH